MDETFIKKIRTAAVAGWWTVLIAYVILLLQWFAYLLIIPRQPAGMIFFWGEGVSWQEIRTIWLWAMVAYKLIVVIMMFGAIWLTLWAKKLSKNQR